MNKVVITIMMVVTLAGAYMLTTTILADHTIAAAYDPSSFVCTGKGTDEELKAMAKQMAQVAQGKAAYTPEVKSCYATLTQSAKARLFEMIAAEQGIVLEHPNTTAPSKSGESAGEQPDVFWTQLVEHANYITSPTAPDFWQRNDYCDGSDPDEDYQFRINFSGAVSNPDGLRNLSSDLVVDAMLEYYQRVYSGIKGSGYTESNTAWVCLGGGGVGTAGGPTNVYNNLRLSRCLSGCW